MRRHCCAVMRVMHGASRGHPAWTLAFGANTLREDALR
ncbi:hypothetical protein GFS60_07048 (plasmid) [Rhodococcus sp. WAY2]|nr:hypothetical protein GFS60_07048 [Rhodococcus sp. WAY2]